MVRLTLNVYNISDPSWLNDIQRRRRCTRRLSDRVGYGVARVQLLQEILSFFFWGQWGEFEGKS